MSGQGHSAEKDAAACTCPYTDPSTWLSAASCGYGSGYEPGSMQEWNPDCPEHRANQSRFACTCGRFIPESAIRYTDHRDDSTFYGIRSEVEWDCSRCGTVKGEGAWEPPLVTFPTRVTPPGSGTSTDAADQ